jgi:hypothetical protein
MNLEDQSTFPFQWIAIECILIFFSKLHMSIWMHILGWVFLVINTLCFIRLGILPMVFFAKNYALYRKIFWVSLFVTIIFAASEIMLFRILISLKIR